MAKIYFAYTGNGITCWRENTNNAIAHISSERVISIYRNQMLTYNELLQLCDIAHISHFDVSKTQHENVYIVPPIITKNYVYRFI